jgi:glutathione gamma-glutamylcysteinyltransferase
MSKTNAKKASPSGGLFHRRTLPSTCIELSSEEGQKRFIRAIKNKIGTEPAYALNLLSQFRTQDEPSYCGISTLVMCLNTLMVDPGQTWKGVWRWWSEELLDCCISLDDAKKQGITLDEFECLAKCQGVDTVKYRPPNLEVQKDSSEYRESYDLFHKTIMEILMPPAPTQVKVPGILVVSYDRKTLGQTGSGHFSPIGAWDAQSSSVLILDVARFKYPPHWVTIDALFEAMRKNDNSTSLPRGWVVIQKSPDVPVLVSAATNVRQCGCLSEFIVSRKTTIPIVSSSIGIGLPNSVSSVATILDGLTCSIEHVLSLVKSRDDVHDTCENNNETKEPVNEYKNIRGRILTDLIKLPLYKNVSSYLLAKGLMENNSNGKLVVDNAERLSLLLLATSPDITDLKGAALGREVILLRKQLLAIHETASKSCC